VGEIALSGPARQEYGDRLELLNDMFLGANSLTQSLLPDLFAGGMPFVAEMRARVRSNITLALERLARHQHFRAQVPDGGYNLFPEVLGWSDEEALVLHLLENGVLVHPGYFYGYERGTHLMIACLAEPARFAEGMERIVWAIDHV